MAALAGRQHGVVATRQLVELGYTRNAIARAKVAGHLHSVHRGVYAVGHTRLTWHGRCMAAALASGSATVVSHRAAAWLWGLLRSRPGAFDITAETRRRHQPHYARVHYAKLVDADRASRDGIPVTAVPRTLLDLAATLNSDRLGQSLERAEEHRLFDLGPMDDLLARTGGHPGAGRLRRALAIYRPPPFTRSGIERRFLELAERAGLPKPATGYNVVGYELDVYWPPQRFAVELDLYETHGSRRSFEGDHVRDEKLKLAGVELLRITGYRLDREPGQVMAGVVELWKRRGGAIGESE